MLAVQICVTPKYSHLMRPITSTPSLREGKVESLLPYKSKIKFVSSKGTCIVSKSQIDYIRSESNYSIVYLNKGIQIVCCRTLKDLSTKMLKSEFVRVHASYLVNLSRIVFINSDYSSLTLESNEIIPISRKRKAALKAIILQHID